MFASNGVDLSGCIMTNSSSAVTGHQCKGQPLLMLGSVAANINVAGELSLCIAV